MGCKEPQRCDGPNGQRKGKGFKTTRCFSGMREMRKESLRDTCAPCVGPENAGRIEVLRQCIQEGLKGARPNEEASAGQTRGSEDMKSRNE